MELIAHRKNTAEQLKETPPHYGVELDLRSQGTRIIIHHDPFTEGEDFETWLQDYRHGTLILNVKEEGLESQLIDLMKKHKITNYFFLDQSFPFLVKYTKLGERRCAVRVSEFESIETALTLAGKLDWVWVDCFTRFPLSAEDGQRLKQAGFKLCLVSPELQGRDGTVEIPALFKLTQKLGIKVDAVCTKMPELWASLVTL